jgi:hypothetical protein
MSALAPTAATPANGNGLRHGEVAVHGQDFCIMKYDVGWLLGQRQ